MTLHEAKYYEKDKDGNVKCRLCPHNCIIKNGKTGICLVRRNIDGKLFAEGYGRITSMALDPIEKKPLYLYRPGCDILSVGIYGCNFKCAFCQNHSISQHQPKFKYISPEKLVSLAKENEAEGNVGLAYTYNEPLTSFEYVYDCAKLAQSVGLKNIVVTNGFINEEPMKELLPFIDAMNIDLKSFSDSFYFNVCGGAIEPVKKTIKLCSQKCHVEVTTLVIPGYNDTVEEIEATAKFIASISSEIPLHLTRHHPDYRMFDPQPIEKERLWQLANIASKYLKNVFCGNC